LTSFIVVAIIPSVLDSPYGLRRVVSGRLFFYRCVVEEQQSDEPFFDEARELVETLGYRLVDLAVTRRGASVQVRLVIFSPTGTGVNECSRVHRLICPRIQVLFGDADPEIEVSSPGLERVLRSPHEFGIFVGKGLRLYSRSLGDWVAGLIDACDGSVVTLNVKGASRVFPISDIAKARLDYSQEVSHL
jgi:ribosome maturation factor RimP